MEDHLPHVWAHQVFDAYAKPKRLVAGDPDYDEPADPWWISSWLHDEHVLMHHLVTGTFATVERMLRTWKSRFCGGMTGWKRMEKAFSNRKTLVCQDGLARAAFCVSRWDSVAVLDRHSGSFGLMWGSKAS